MAQTIDPFDNDWSKVKATPEDRFQRVTYRDVLMRSSSWSLPDEWALIVRYEHPETGTVVEKAYRTQGKAEAAILKKEAEGWEHTYYDNEAMSTSILFGDEGDDD